MNFIALRFNGLAYITELGGWEWIGPNDERMITQAFKIYSMRSKKLRIYSLCPRCARLHCVKTIESN